MIKKIYWRIEYYIKKLYIILFYRANYCGLNKKYSKYIKLGLLDSKYNLSYITKNGKFIKVDNYGEKENGN